VIYGLPLAHHVESLPGHSGPDPRLPRAYGETTSTRKCNEPAGVKQSTAEKYRSITLSRKESADVLFESSLT